MTTTNDDLIAEAELGEEARAFVESDLGRFMLGAAKQEIEAAQDALLSVDPNDPQKIRELQNHAWRARQFEQWLVELIEKGENALITWRQQNES